MVATIIRNLDPREKLMNGTMVRIEEVLNNRLIKVHVYATGRTALISRINFGF